MRERSSVILIKQKKVALIKREWNEEVYYVVPGGGIEQGESPEQTAIRSV
ncbi:NUDIX domain-containing protein [Alkalihalobacillus sp. AL-G]